MSTDTVNVLIEHETGLIEPIILSDVPVTTTIFDVLKRHPLTLAGTDLIANTIAVIINNTRTVNLYDQVGHAPGFPVALACPAPAPVPAPDATAAAAPAPVPVPDIPPTSAASATSVETEIAAAVESAAASAEPVPPAPACAPACAPEGTVVIRLLPINTYDSWCIMRSTLAWLLPWALSRVDEGLLTTVSVHHSSGRQLCFDSTVPFSDGLRAQIAQALHDICNQALPIRRSVVSNAEAHRMLEGSPHTPILSSYQLNGKNISVGYVGNDAEKPLWTALYPFALAHNTSFCGTFEIRSEHLGRRMVIHLPRVTDFNVMPDNLREPTPALAIAYDMGVSVADRLRVTSLSALNNMTPAEFNSMVREAEIHMDTDIRNIARLSCAGPDPVPAAGEGAMHSPTPAPCTRKLVAIAGPSSSGKTTFSLRLSAHLESFGRRPVALALDNYYKPVSEVPLQPNGQPDFETIDALRVDLIAEHISTLLSGGRVRVPEVDFENCCHYDDRGPEVQLGPHDVLVIEGIHALNPRIIEKVDRSQVFKIFIAPLTAVRIDSFTRLSTADMRLVRRMSRDARTRGASATDTLRFWPAVRHGEKTHIYPWSETADIAFNSATCFELAVLKQGAVQLLHTVPEGHRDYYQVHRILKVLSWVSERSGEAIPPESLIREFLGGGKFGVK